MLQQPVRTPEEATRAGGLKINFNSPNQGNAKSTHHSTNQSTNSHARCSVQTLLRNSTVDSVGRSQRAIPSVPNHPFIPQLGFSAKECPAGEPVPAAGVHLWRVPSHLKKPPAALVAAQAVATKRRHAGPDSSNPPCSIADSLRAVLPRGIHPPGFPDRLDVDQDQESD